MDRVSPDAAVLALAIIDATLVALFFLFRVLPWSSRGPWRLVWMLATLTSMCFILGEAQAAVVGGEALAPEHQGPLFGAILSASAAFIFVYLHGPRSLERERAEQERELHSRSEYMSIVAHELRNPLVAISSAARVLARGGGDAGSTASGIADEARAALALVDGLTDLASIEAGRLVSALRPLDLAAVVRETVRSAHAEREITLAGVDSALRVLGDERRLAEVIRNLISNAVKYSPAGTPIEVLAGLTPDQQSAVVSVRDHGSGVPPAERGKLFQKFARLSTAGGTRGSGLGLYICREIVRDHRGELTADWPPGGGSIFSFTIPLDRR